MKFFAIAAAIFLAVASATVTESSLKKVAHNKIQNTVNGRRMMVEKMHGRKLQENATACDAAFVALLEDETLAAATDAYLLAYEAQADQLDVSDCEIGEDSASCDFTSYAPSTADLESACSALGGSLSAYDSNMACTVTLDGQTASFFFDYAPLYLCVPTVEGEDCKGEVQAISDEVDQEVEAQMETALSLAGLPGSCDVGPDVSAAGSVSSGIAALTGVATAMAFLLV